MKYIDGKEKNGIDYDWKKIKKKLKDLNIPKEFHTPVSVPLGECHWFVEMSDRSRGKTTNWLLLGLVMNQMYGTTIEYVRQIEDMITPKTSKDIFKTILEYHYVEKVTDGKWNAIFYKARRWYFCNRDDDGLIIEQDSEHFMMMLSVDRADIYKSSLVAPKGDLIIFDEFVGKYYYKNEFVTFCDLVKTLIRERQSPIIALLSNTIDKESQYFNELEIIDNVKNMRLGSKEIITTTKNTRIYFEILAKATLQNKARSKVNELFFGFKNPRISSITGDDWSIDNYQHIPEFEKEIPKLVSLNHYLSFNGKLVNIELWSSNALGLYVCVHFATKTHDDSIVYTLGDIHTANERFKFGHTAMDKLIWSMYQRNKFYYATNDVGALIDKYVVTSKQY